MTCLSCDGAASQELACLVMTLPHASPWLTFSFTDSMSLCVCFCCSAYWHTTFPTWATCHFVSKECCLTLLLSSVCQRQQGVEKSLSTFPHSLASWFAAQLGVPAKLLLPKYSVQLWLRSRSVLQPKVIRGSILTSSPGSSTSGFLLPVYRAPSRASHFWGW